MVEMILRNGAGEALEQCDHEKRVHMVVKGEYAEGARISVKCESKHLWFQVDQAVAPALLYVPQGVFDYDIPQGEALLAYPPQAFRGDTHLIRAWLPETEEVTRRRNLACNPADQRRSVTAYPHIEANVETRGESVFAVRNVIDGYTENISHGEWPYQSWGIEVSTDACCKLDFGRMVRVDEMKLVLRADFPHDAYWEKATVVLSDGEEICFELKHTGEPQTIDLGEHTVSWMRLEKLIKAKDDPSPFPSLSEWEVYGVEL